MSQKIYPVAVIGGGSAGTMAVLRTVLNNDETLFFPGAAKEKKKSRALWVSKVENIPGHLDYKKGIEEPNRESLLWLSTGDFKDKFHWIKNRSILHIKKNQEGLFELKDSKDESYLAKYVILCTGVMDVQPEIQGSIEPVFPFANAQFLDYCLRCDGHHVLGKETVVIGHESGAAWVAAMLYERYATPAMKVLTNGKVADFDDDVTELLKLYNIEVITSAIKEVLGETKPPKLEGFALEDGKKISAQIGFISLGMIVYNQLALELGAECDNRGFVVADSQGKSTIDGLYVAGDLRAKVKKQIYTAWDTAVDSADAINTLLRREKRLKLIGESK